MADGTENGDAKSRIVNLDDCPIEDLPRFGEYREAVEKESRARSEAFVPGLRRFICGVEVLPLTLSHATLLRAVDSPFVEGRSGLPTAVEVAQFLWCLSPQYQFWQGFRKVCQMIWPWFAEWMFNRARDGFISRIRRIPYAPAIVAIDSYMEGAFADSPGGGGRIGFFANYYSGEAAVISDIANHHGWTEREIMNIPVERLWQYIRRIQRKNNPNCTLFNPSDKVKVRIAGHE